MLTIRRSVMSGLLLMVLLGVSGCFSRKVVIVDKPAIDPCKEAEAHVRQGLVYAQNQDYRNSEKELTEAIRLCPNSAEAHANLGVLYIQMDALNKAERSLQQALSLSPRDPNALYNLTAVYSLTNKVDLALETLDQALAAGFYNLDALRNDPDLTNLRRDPGFREVLEKHRIFL